MPYVPDEVYYTCLAISLMVGYTFAEEFGINSRYKGIIISAAAFIGIAIIFDATMIMQLFIGIIKLIRFEFGI